jgi:hypothetical protein
MAGPYDTSLAALRVCTTINGTYTLVGYVRSTDFTEGSDGASETKYLGGSITKAGDPNLSVSTSVLFNREDTTGQEIIRSAKRSGASVFLQVCPDGYATGKKVEQAEYKVDEVGMSINADNDWVEVTMSFTGVPSTLTTVTLA